MEADTVLDALMLVNKGMADAMIGYSYQNYLISKYLLIGVVPAYFTVLKSE